MAIVETTKSINMYPQLDNTMKLLVLMKKKRLVKVLVNILQRWIILTISCFINDKCGCFYSFVYYCY